MLSREDAIRVLGEERAELYFLVLEEFAGPVEELSPEEVREHKLRIHAASAPPLTDPQRARLGPILSRAIENE